MKIPLCKLKSYISKYKNYKKKKELIRVKKGPFFPRDVVVIIDHNVI